MFENEIAAGWDYEDMSRGRSPGLPRPACERGRPSTKDYVPSTSSAAAVERILEETRHLRERTS